MAVYEITIDYTVVFRTTVEADTPEEAKEIAERQAYQDSWSSGGTWGGCDIIECELEENDSGK